MNGHDPKQTVRAFVSMKENMKRMHGEIERYLYAAEITCIDETNCTGCSFRKRYPDEKGKRACILPELRKIIGDV